MPDRSRAPDHTKRCHFPPFSAPQRLRWIVRIGLLLSLSQLILVGATTWAAEPRAEPSGDPDPGSEASRSALERFVRQRALRGARIGVAVIDLESGERLLARQADRPLVPASNQKLMTAAAALETWGPAHRFETWIQLEQELPESGVVEGPLWIVGHGDPSLVSESLWRMAEEVRLAGVTEVRGGLAVDTSWFDNQRTHPDWGPISRRAYHAPIAAFAANYSSFRVEIRAASEVQRRARVVVVPSIPYFKTRADALTIPGRGQLSLELAELPDGSGERVSVRGAMRAGERPRTYWRSVSRPERYAAELLRSLLEAQGIRISGAVRVGKVPEDAQDLIRFKGETLADIIRDMNKYSNNFIAELLLKGMAAERTGLPGSWRAGASLVKSYLEQADVADAGTIIVDGSGLSPRNRVSPATLARLIRHAVSQRGSGPEFLASLPIGGLDGTLEERVYDASRAVRGKTGHLRSVATLSGVIPSRSGRKAFAVMVNGARTSRLDVDAAIDEFVSRLAELESPVEEPLASQAHAP